VTLGGKQAKTTSSGLASLTFGPAPTGAQKATVTAPGYSTATQTVQL
jgi:hypothetical protein